MDILLREIKNIYKKQTYFEKYGGLIWLALLIIIVFISIISYFVSQGSREALKSNWIVNRCRPSVIPFAGYINNPSDKGKMEYTQENFSYCIESILGAAFKAIISPIIGQQSSIGNMFSSIPDVFEKMGDFLQNILNSIKSLIDKIINYLQNVLFNIKKFLGSFKGIFSIIKAMQVLFKKMILNALLTTAALMYWLIGKIRSWVDKYIYTPFLSIISTSGVFMIIGLGLIVFLISAPKGWALIILAGILLVIAIVLLIIYCIIIAIIRALLLIVDLFMKLVEKFRKM